MDPKEVIVKEMQGKCRLKVLELFRESIRQPRTSTHLHSHSQVLSLNEAR